MSMTGMVFDISHYMIEDGPGIRTNVFMKGCGLRCKWCSNAYGLEQRIQLSYDKNKCIACGSCLKACQNQAIAWSDLGHIVTQDFDRCSDCMQCVSVCPTKARKQIGRRLSAKEVVQEVERDRLFYRRGNGGVTMSGGEILMQPEFVGEVLRLCQKEGIHTAIETSAFGNWEDLKNLINHSDTVFIDCKYIDSDRHRKLTGVDNTKILHNIKWAAQLCAEDKRELIIRFPLIPTMNDDEDNIRNTAQYVNALPGKPLLNVLPYHNFGASKYEFLGKNYEAQQLLPQEKESLDRVRNILEQSPVRYSVGGYDI